MDIVWAADRLILVWYIQRELLHYDGILSVVGGCEKVPGVAFDNCDLLAPADSTRQRQQAQALAIGSNPLGQGGQPQEQAAGVVHQPSRRVEDQEAQTLRARRQQLGR